MASVETVTPTATPEEDSGIESANSGDTSSTNGSESEFKTPSLPGNSVTPEEKTETSPPDEAELKEEASPKTEEIAGEPLRMSLHAPALDYDPPPWACEPPEGSNYALEVIKNGSIVQTIDLGKRKHSSFVVIGRLPTCDIQMDHPTISRHHCILQYGEDTMGKSGRGWHMYDLGSTHGSKANRKKMPGNQYIRMHIGWVLQFGMSSRSLTLMGPDDEKEAEWDLSPTEWKEKMKRQALEKKAAAQAKAEFEEQKRKEEEAAKKDEGIDWGMDYEVGDSGLMHVENADAHLMEDHEAYYREDPKKALSKFFEREGFDMEFVFTESGVNSNNHKWICSIELPVDTGSGRALHASATVSTSKKDAQVQCSLEACRVLDAHGVLRKSTARTKLRRRTLEDDDFYDEDEDEYLDRTGQIQAQRKRRKARAHGSTDGESKAQTYQGILVELEETRKEIASLNKKHDELSQKTTVVDGVVIDDGAHTDDLQTKTKKSEIRQRVAALTHQAQRLEQLAKIAKPVALPELKLPTTTAGSGGGSADKQAFMRKMMQMGRKKKQEEPKMEARHTSEDTSDNEEKFVPEEDEDESTSTSVKGMTLPPAMRTSEKPKEIVEKSSTDLPEPETVEVKAAEPEPKPESEVKKPELPPSTSSTPTKEVPDSKAGEVRKPATSGLRKRTIEEIRKEHEEAEAEVERELEELAEKKRRKRVYKHKEKRVETGGDYGEGVEDKEEQYATWLPPENQSGDGTTRLNEKFAGRY